MLYRQIFFDGCNGWRLGGVVETEPCEDGLLYDEDGAAYGSRNGDGLYDELEEGQSLLVPILPEGFKEDRAPEAGDFER